MKQLFFLSFALFSIFSCSNSTDPEASDIVLPESDITYIDHIQPLFVKSCASRSGCHGVDNPVAGLDVSNFDILKQHFIDGGSEPLIRFEDGENSALYKILIFENFLGVPRMPLNGPYLNENQTNGVKVWIDEGAVYSAK